MPTPILSCCWQGSRRAKLLHSKQRWASSAAVAEPNMITAIWLTSTGALTCLPLAIILLPIFLKGPRESTVHRSSAACVHCVVAFYSQFVPIRVSWFPCSDSNVPPCYQPYPSRERSRRYSAQCLYKVAVFCSLDYLLLHSRLPSESLVALRAIQSTLLSWSSAVRIPRWRATSSLTTRYL